jgi:uncharacterized protein (TIGR03435 family)
MTKVFARDPKSLLMPVVWGIISLVIAYAPVAWSQSNPTTQTALSTKPASEVEAKGDIVGDWQGTLGTDKPLRLVLKIARAHEGLSGNLYYFFLGQESQLLKVSSIVLEGSSFKFSIQLMDCSYVGKLSEDGNTITGIWMQGPKPQALTLIRATKETAWEIPAPHRAPKMMAVDADPSYDVVTIKPNPSGAANMQGPLVRAGNVAFRNGSLRDLISFAFNVQMKQIVNGPHWIDKDRYDINGVPNQEGLASYRQLRGMIQKLLADRFRLKFHYEKREVPVFVLAIGKNGQKLKPTAVNMPYPGIFVTPGADGLTITAINATMSDLSSFLQMRVLDRPVVDHTALDGKFDFKCTFTPDASEFDGLPPKLPTQMAQTGFTSPDLFGAIEQQLGLKLTAEKASLDIISIDHIESPSPN